MPEPKIDGDEDQLHVKYRVERRDGRDKAGGDKADAAYFVLDYAHDPYAAPALLAYAAACRDEMPGLARDLETAARSVPTVDDVRRRWVDDRLDRRLAELDRDDPGSSGVAVKP